jgi:hypothetical protein
VEAENTQLGGTATTYACSRCHGKVGVKALGHLPGFGDGWLTINGINVAEPTAVSVSAWSLTDHDRYLQISVNGGTAMWVLCGPCGAVVQLAAGTNSIKIFNGTTVAPELDMIAIHLASESS